ncbi:FAS1 domain-containing protein [Crepidotus variabilis]|uniref:FAS1 domain-containing protein n=1 Tax=Crepidotus variabilis TaxID=179855 RepID=A0A9P6EF37_9AGAR|nr:FAS1 domain-containing protein [Crepidotus variabilis]
MRISSACQSVLWAALLPISSFAAQIPLSSSPKTSSTTLVDVLNSDPTQDYTSLLKLLQRTKLIPTLNRLNGSTFFAPTNDAIKKYSLRNSLWLAALEESEDALTDNIQEELRQQLFYHLLNETLDSLPSGSNVQFYKTLLYPRKPLPPPSGDPPPYPPWMPIPNGTLGHEPQRLRLATRGDRARVAVDAFGKGGVKVVKDTVKADNGIVVGIDKVIEPPPDLATLLSHHSSLSYLNKIVTPEILDRLNTSSRLTLFLPVDKAWEGLDPIERLYLESKYATDDLHRIVNMHAVEEGPVVWSDSFEDGLNLTTVHGTTLNIHKTSDRVTVRGTDLIHPDIYASNGVLHLVEDLLLPPGALQLTPEKYLLALNCTKFVSLLHSVNLTHLINDTDTKYTILAPRDDIIATLDDPTFPQPGSEELKRLLQYHFIPGNWTPSKLKDGTLLKTALKEPGLNYTSQVLPVEVQTDDKKKAAEMRIRFGGAGVIGDPIQVNKTVIYYISQALVPPPDVFQAALPILELSSFLAALSSTSQGEPLRTAPSTSFLIPRNEAFKRLGLLVSAHLLAPSSKEDLENVIQHHVLNTVEYAEALRNGSQHSFATLEGSDIKIERQSNGSAFVSSSGGWDGFKAELHTKDLLTQTGVIHEMSDIMIPRSVQLTIGKLMKAAKGSTMSTLLNKAGFEWILNGTAPPEDSSWFNKAAGHVGWTVLCPPDDAFKTYNLTKLLSDPGLTKIVEQHLIPTPPESSVVDETSPLNNNRPLVFDKASYNTVRSGDSDYGDLVIEPLKDSSGYIIGIKGARGQTDKSDWARITAWGRSTVGSGTGGVVQIDKMLLPYQPSWWVVYGAPFSTGAGGVILICAFFYGVRAIWRRDTTEATFEPVGGFGRDDDEGS